MKLIILGVCVGGWVVGGGEGVEGYWGVEGGLWKILILKEMCLLIFFIWLFVVIFFYIFFGIGVI